MVVVVVVVGGVVGWVSGVSPSLSIWHHLMVTSVNK